MAEINRLEDLLQIAIQLTRRWNDMSPWWRGHADDKWTLTPGVFRGGRKRIDERNMATRFMSKAHTRRADCPRADDLPGWFSLMQHYRLPTRLLDWSEMPL